MNKSLQSLEFGNPKISWPLETGISCMKSVYVLWRKVIYLLAVAMYNLFIKENTPHGATATTLCVPPLWPKHNSSMSYNSFRLYCFQLWSIHFALLRKEWRSSGKHHCQFWRIHDVLKSTRVKGYQKWKGSLSEEQCGGPEGQKTKILRGIFFSADPWQPTAAVIAFSW